MPYPLIKSDSYTSVDPRTIFPAIFVWPVLKLSRYKQTFIETKILLLALDGVMDALKFVASAKDEELNTVSVVIIDCTTCNTDPAGNCARVGTPLESPAAGIVLIGISNP